MNASADGSSHSAAVKGDKPSTNCRNCATNRWMPAMKKAPDRFTSSAARNAGRRNKARSTKGWTSWRWRRRNTTPSARPSRLAASASKLKPVDATCLTP